MMSKIIHCYAARDKDYWETPKSTRIYPSAPINIAGIANGANWRYGRNEDCFFNWDLGLGQGECKKAVILLQKDYDELVKSYNKEIERDAETYEKQIERLLDPDVPKTGMEHAALRRIKELEKESKAEDINKYPEPKKDSL